MQQYNLPELATDLAALTGRPAAEHHAELNLFFHVAIPDRLKIGPIVIQNFCSIHVKKRTYPNPGTPDNADDRVVKNKPFFRSSPALDKAVEGVAAQKTPKEIPV